MKSVSYRMPLRVLAASLAALVFAGSLASVTPAFAGFNSPGDFDRPLVMKRARAWYLDSPRYSQSRFYNGYRTDCSGYVSMAWGLKRSLTTVTLPRVAWRITKSDLKAGDVMLDFTGPSKHVVIFDQWANKQQTAYWEYELSGSGERVRHRVVPYPFWTRDRDQYKPYRFAKSPQYAGKQPPKPVVKAAPAPAPPAGTTATPASTVTSAAKDATPTLGAKSARSVVKPGANAPQRSEKRAQIAKPEKKSTLEESASPVSADARPAPEPVPAPAAAVKEQLSEPVAIALVRTLVAWIAD